MTDSFFPAAKKVVANPIVKWVGGAILSLLVSSFTIGVYPFFKGWVITRASTEQVETVEKRLTDLEKLHTVNFERLNNAKGDDTSALTESEQLQWAILRIKRQRLQTVTEIRTRIGLEAMLKMPNPRSDGAKRIAAAVRAKFDDLMFKGEEPNVAAERALEYVYGHTDE